MRFIITLFCALMAGATALAHPHIWVYTTVELIEENGKAKGIRLHWNFDEMYSSTFLLQADENKNGKLEEDETLFTRAEVFENNPEGLTQFMLFKFNGEETQTTNFKDIKIWFDDKETLHYSFDLIFDAPKELTGKHTIGFFDPEFYVSFEQDLDMKLAQNSQCNATLMEDPQVTIYDGLIHPETYQLTCN
jgi:ABC-type uncharacterized transport system substrate-binding protein